MTEKQYGGQTGRRTENKSMKNNNISNKPKINPSEGRASDSARLNPEGKSEKSERGQEKGGGMDKSQKLSYQEKILRAGKIASETREYAKKIIKKDIPLLEIAEKIENKIIELDGKPAFPANLSINETAAHYTPSYDDKTLAYGLLKVDFGVSIDGWCSDQSFSMDLENSEENKKLIQTSQEALSKAIELISKKIEKKEILKTGEIGKAIQETIESYGFLPIINLSGHQIDQNDLHAGLTIPNIDNNSTEIISHGLYAIEPFVTLNFASGKVKDGKPSGIYQLINTKFPRMPLARKIMEFISKEYQGLPFCSRWIIKKFGTSALFSLKQLEENGNLHQFSQLVESSGKNVAQAEHTIFIEDGKVVVTTL